MKNSHKDKHNIRKNAHSLKEMQSHNTTTKRSKMTTMRDTMAANTLFDLFYLINCKLIEKWSEN